MRATDSSSFDAFKNFVDVPSEFRFNSGNQFFSRHSVHVNSTFRRGDDSNDFVTERLRWAFDYVSHICPSVFLIFSVSVAYAFLRFFSWFSRMLDSKPSYTMSFLAHFSFFQIIFFEAMIFGLFTLIMFCDQISSIVQNATGKVSTIEVS